MKIKSSHTYSWRADAGEAHAQVNHVEGQHTQHGDAITHIIQVSLSSIYAIIYKDDMGEEQVGTVVAAEVDDPYEFDELFRDIYVQHKAHMKSGECKCAGCGVDLSEDGE